MIDVKITKTVRLSAEDLDQVETVSYYDNGSEWDHITLTYTWDAETGWGMTHARGSLWRLTKKGTRIRNSLTRGYFPTIPQEIRDKNRPTNRVRVEVEDDE